MFCRFRNVAATTDYIFPPCPTLHSILNLFSSSIQLKSTFILNYHLIFVSNLIHAQTYDTCFQVLHYSSGWHVLWGRCCPISCWWELNVPALWFILYFDYFNQEKGIKRNGYNIKFFLFKITNTLFLLAIGEGKHALKSSLVLFISQLKTMIFGIKASYLWFCWT